MSLFGFRSDKNVAVRKFVTSGISSALVVGTLVCTPIAIAEPLSMTEVSLNLQATISSQTLPIGNTTIKNSIDLDADNVISSIDAFVNKEKIEQTETTSNSDDSSENETNSSDDGGNHPSGSVDDEPTSGGETPMGGEENQLPTTPVPPSNDNGDAGSADGGNTTEGTDTSERSGGPSLFAVHTGNWGTVPWTFDDVTGVLSLGPGTGVNQPVAGDVPSSTPWQAYRNSIKKVVFTGATGTTKAPANMFGLFYNYSNLESIEDPNQAFDTSATTRFELMFGSCVKLKSIDLRHWDLRNAIYTNLMFSGCTVLEIIDTSQWVTTTKLINMCGMFQFSGVKELDLSGFNMTNVLAGASGTSPLGNKNGSGSFTIFNNCNSLRVLKLGPFSRTYNNNALVSPPGNNLVSFVTDGLQTDTQRFMAIWQEIGTGTVDDPQGAWMGNSAQLTARSQNSALAPGTYVWRPKYEVKLDGNGGNWAAVNPSTGLPATDAFLYVPRPATVGGAGQTVNLTSPNPITSLPTNTSSNFYGWTTTPDLLSTKTTTIGPLNSDTTVYALWSKLEIISSPTDFDFGSNPFSRLTRSLNLDPGSPMYTPADVTNGFDLTVGSNALVKWQISATLDPFVDSVSLGGALPVGVGLDITGMTHKEQTSPPTTQLPVFNPNLSLPADGTTSQIIAGSGALPADGGGVWEISIPFNNVKLTVPPVSNAYVGHWKSTLTWSLEDLP